MMKNYCYSTLKKDEFAKKKLKIYILIKMREREKLIGKQENSNLEKKFFYK